MKMNRHRIARTACALMLTLLMAGLVVIYAPQRAYAEGGNATVTLGNVEGLAEGTEFEFRMYKVGHYNGEDIELDDTVKDANVKLDYDKDDAAGWLDSAWTLSEYIDNNGISLEAVGGAHALKPGESFTEAVTEDGIYLVKSSTVRDSDDATVSWTPQPVFIKVFNGDAKVTINNDVVVKVVKTVDSIKHRVVKIWDIPAGKEKEAKPAEINVSIYYENAWVDVVKLTPDNNWTYDWETDASDGKWTCEEIFTEKAFKEAYGREPSKEEAAELKKLAERFNVQKLADTVIEDGDNVVTLHRIKNVYKQTPPPPPGPDTGDENRVALWAGIFGAACLLLIILFAVKRKREGSKN